MGDFTLKDLRGFFGGSGLEFHHFRLGWLMFFAILFGGFMITAKCLSSRVRRKAVLCIVWYCPVSLNVVAILIVCSYYLAG